MIFFQGSSRVDEEYIMKQFDINCKREVSHNMLNPMKLCEIPGEPKKEDGLKKQQESEFFQELEPEPKVVITGEDWKSKWKLY